MFTVGLDYYCYNGKATKRFLFSNIEEKKKESSGFWWVESRAFRLLGQNPLFSPIPHKGEAETRQTIGVALDRERKNCQPYLEKTALCWARHRDGLIPFVPSHWVPSLPECPYHRHHTPGREIWVCPWGCREWAGSAPPSAPGGWWCRFHRSQTEQRTAPQRRAVVGKGVETGWWDSDRTLVLSANEATPRLQCPWPIPPAKSKFGLWWKNYSEPYSEDALVSGAQAPFWPLGLGIGISSVSLHTIIFISLAVLTSGGPFYV